MGAIAATAAGPIHHDDQRWPVAAWKESLSEPVYTEIESWVEYLTAPDGTQLSVSVHLPANAPPTAELPTLLQLTPYQSFNRPRLSAPVVGTDAPLWAWSFAVERGAAYVEADLRGTGASGGCLDFGGSKDRADAAAIVAWVRDQPWSNGVVTTDGMSHPGLGSLAAHAAVPDLAASLAQAPVVSYYHDTWYQGAYTENTNTGPGYAAVDASPPAYADANALAAQAAACPDTVSDFAPGRGAFTDLWADRDLSLHAERAEAPVMLAHGFEDITVNPDQVQLYWDALPADHPKHLLLGWWEHTWPVIDTHPWQSFADVRHRWLDTALFGIENGLDAEPRVAVEDFQGTWHEGDQWPLEESERVTLHPSADGGLSERTGPAGALSYTDALGARRAEWANASVVFASDPLDEARLVNGAPEVELVASSNLSETKWVLYLIDEHPDGSWYRVTHGYADSHTREPRDDRWTLLGRDQVATWHVPLWPTAYTVEEGHRLLFVVASQDSRTSDYEQLDTPCWPGHRGGCYRPVGILPAATAGRATNTVYVGEGGTEVLLDWVDPALTRKPPGGEA